MNNFSRVGRFFRIATVTVCVAAAPAIQATPLQPVPSLDIAGVGLEVAYGGTGMEGRTGAISVDIGGSVFRAVLYWAGRDRPCLEDGGVFALSAVPMTKCSWMVCTSRAI